MGLTSSHHLQLHASFSSSNFSPVSLAQSRTPPSPPLPASRRSPTHPTRSELPCLILTESHVPLLVASLRHSLFNNAVEGIFCIEKKPRLPSYQATNLLLQTSYLLSPVSIAHSQPSLTFSIHHSTSLPRLPLSPLCSPSLPFKFLILSTSLSHLSVPPLYPPVL